MARRSNIVTGIAQGAGQGFLGKLDALALRWHVSSPFPQAVGPNCRFRVAIQNRPRATNLTRLYQYGRNKPCYFCGAPGPSTKEHVPPKTLTSVVQCDRITVPSCEEHNSSKSGTDQAITQALVRGIDQIRSFGIRLDVPDSLNELIRVTSPEYSRTQASVYLARICSRLPRGLDFDLPYLRQHVDIADWVVKATAALVWSITGTHDNGCDWARAWTWSPSYFPAPVAMQPRELNDRIKEKRYLLNLFEGDARWFSGWVPGRRPYPSELYNFRVGVENESASRQFMVSFRHQFLSSYIYYCRLSTSALVRDAIFQFSGGPMPEIRTT